MRVLVIGCGVSGLSCGIRLLEDGFDVTIRARERTPHTTSDVAAAVFYPYRAAPASRVLAWCRHSLQVFTALAREPASGVTMVELLEVFEGRAPDPWWKELLPELRRAGPADLPPGFEDGLVLRVPRIEMPVYMRFLERRFEELGGRIEPGEVTDLSSAARAFGLAVDCAGLGARELARDPEVFPIRGQIARVRRLPGMERCLAHDPGPAAPAYVVPRSDDVVLGGTATDHDGNLEPDAVDERAILERCARLAPALAHAEIVGRAVGLRPGRRQVRLESERAASGAPVIHDYGHGGAGVTLSWGCAAEVVQLARRVGGD